MRTLQTSLAVFLLVAAFSAFGQADQAIISAVDSPDPVIPGTSLTYTITFQNNGPNPAVNGGVNLLFDANFTPTSATPPAGFNCTALTQIMSCTSPSFAPGGPVVLTVVGTVAAHLNTFPDGTLTSSFSTSGVTPDPVPGNNSSGNIVTTYNSPQVDLSLIVVDSPDPVFPNGDITYTVDVTNSGPDTANSVNFNVFNNGSLRFQSVTIPAGWSCPSPPAVGGNPTFTCTRATWAPGTSQFLVVVRADPTVLGINDGTVSTYFGVAAGASDETDDGTDNSETESTQYVTPDADISVAVTDSPDPVFPDGNITYTVTVANAGPDTAPSVTLSSFGANNLRFQSATVPAGWNCTLPAAGTQTTSLTCTRAGGMAVGGSSVLTFVMQADDALLGINDQTILFGFSASSPIADPVAGNNSETESTAYVTPDADISVSVSDSPDPVGPDGNITYTVTVANAGPDAAPSVTLSSFGANNLRFQSATVPAGWNCTLPSAGTQTTSLTCTLPGGMVSGGSSVLTFVMQADDALIGNADTTITFGFSATSTVSDPDNTDNSETESTLYDVANANLGVTATDAPDPVAAGSNLTYTGGVTNAGPDTATNVSLQIPLHSGLLFQSIVAPAGFTCVTPAVGANGMITCTIASLANGANLPFSLVTQVNPSLNNGPDGIIQQGFLIGSSTNDPTIPNNSLTVDTAYTTPDANLVATNSASPATVAPGAVITYTQTLTNNGPDTAVNATFNQTVPVGTVFESFTPPAGWTCALPGTGAINCSKAMMLSGEVAAFTLVVRVAGTGTIGSTVTGDSDTYDPDTTNNSATAATNVVAAPNADLAVTKTTTATSAPVGSTFNYTVTVTNNGPDAASSVTMTDVLPASLLFRQITAAAGFTCTTPAFRTNGTVSCTAATLANGASAVFTLTVEVAQGASGSIINGVTVGSATGDSNGGNSSTSAPGVVPGPSAASMAILKTTTSDTAAPGTNVTYTITVSNSGPSTATNVVVNDTLPAGLQFVSATPSQGTCNAASPVVCNLGSILNGGNATITLVAQVTATSGTVSNTATVTSPDTSGPVSATSRPTAVTSGEPIAAIPTLSEWMLLILAGLLGVAALTRIRF
jgi:uncharacterized repeat protein (TIGR01451 family)